MLTKDEPEISSDNEPFSPATADGTRSSSRHRYGTYLRNLTGGTVLLVGVAGLALPILPGWFLIGWGVILLAPSVPLCARLLDKVEEKVPKLRSTIRRFRHRECGRKETGVKAAG